MERQWSANTDYLNIAALGGCNASEFLGGESAPKGPCLESV